MIEWLNRMKRHNPAPLTGAPVVRRQKTYSAQSGYVYQYFYAGHRDSGDPPGCEIEFVFEVSADRKTTFPVSVLVQNEAVRAWEEQHGRSMTNTEVYAIAKMALFQAFDEREAPARMKADVRVRHADLSAIVETLGID